MVSTRKSTFAIVALSTLALAGIHPLFARGKAPRRTLESSVLPQAECRFSDGGTISFGRDSSGLASSTAVWRTGPYLATTVTTNKHMVIPPLDTPLEIPAGTYTLFVMDQGVPPWTVIISRKIIGRDMPYPGPQFDLGRAQMGSDAQPDRGIVAIGCSQQKNAPIFLWVESGAHVGYAKIMAEALSNGKIEYQWH